MAIIPNDYCTKTDPLHYFPYQVTVRKISTGQWVRHNSWAKRSKGMSEARDCARWGYLNDWDRVAIHDCQTGELIKIHKAALDEQDRLDRFTPKPRRRKSKHVSFMGAVFGVSPIR